MKQLSVALLFTATLFGCSYTKEEVPDTTWLAEEVKNETIRAWEAYTRYAWGHDELLPLSRGYNNWYDEPMYISLSHVGCFIDSWAETMKYFYLAFSKSDVSPENYLFNTEAHPYRITNFDRQLAGERLGIK